MDEVDSLLIDDCRNPMLISGSSAKPVDRYRVATQVNICSDEVTPVAPGQPLIVKLL